MNEKILVAEDDPAILTGVADLLEIEGYRVVKAEDGKTALELYKKENPDLLLLDVMMPLLSGYDVCRNIRRDDSLTPILMLTAKGEEVDKVVGLELGADDYIVKPFGMAELTARIRSALRRAALPKNNARNGYEAELVLHASGVTVDFDAMTGRDSDGRTFSLTPKETALLGYFAANPGKAVSRETLLDVVWGIDPDCDITTRSVDQHVARLRQKIEQNPAEPRLIHTVHGVGYRFENNR
ncbi:MAG: response regulator transcription factor [Synergistaceae bacterium]|nr:response regulator transcription factor [Synergistaceae bacterium]